ncbi:unnamed protein product [Peronospora farinosa]|uniref:Uncharacterized protein n=1 Tax=Peronospora farinosa TaxID=134698 RepID=A0AAV0UUN6_9STRA|nr:unnamed protein product [Peronospora farinosa]
MVGLDAMARLLYLSRSLPACRDHGETALSLLLPKRSALMALCSILLYASSFLLSTSPTQFVELIHLLYHRLGKHVICSLTYFSDTGSAADTRKTSCFLEASTVLLNKYVQKASIWDEEKLTKKSDKESNEEADKEEGVKEGKYLFQMEACQCYCCYTTCKFCPDAKITNEGPPLLHSKMKRTWLALRGLLQKTTALPLPFDANDTTTELPDKICVGHSWYLIYANFSLGRAKRRGNLAELMELEQHIRKRVQFLMKDVLYYHPDRVDSWVCLGKTMKELYHAATDAFAAVLGRKLRVRAFQ